RLGKYFNVEEAKRIYATTTHSFKGREAGSVVVADADDDSYPFLHHTAELFSVFADTIKSLIEEEKRLFYVATTRARTSLWYLISGDESSRFLESAAFMEKIDWGRLEALTGSEDVFELRVHDGYEVSDRLKKPFGFRFNDATEAWHV